MKNRTILTLLYLLAIGLLFGFSFLPEGFRMYSSALALFLPLAIGVLVFAKKNGFRIPMYEGKGDGALPYLFYAPILLMIIFISLATSLVMALFGLSDPPLNDIPLFEAIVTYAVIPAILEECFYRVLPAMALGDEDTKSICIISTLLFGFAHLSVFSIPYALFAGLSFFFINRLAKSPLPSILLHLLNNLLSILFMYTENYEVVFSLTMKTLIILSVASIALMWLFYKDRLRELADEIRAPKERFRATWDIVAYLALTGVLTILFI